VANLSPEQELEQFGYHQQLHRGLSFWQLTAFGLNYMTPIAPAIVFGFILQASGGSVILPFLLGGIGMSFTAITYALLVRKFPIAGSLYSYVSHAWHPRIGFIAGWILLLDYILIPTIMSMSSVLYLQDFLPHVPYSVLLFLFIAITGLLNLFDVKVMARLGLWLLLIGELVIFAGFAVWAYAVKVKGMGVGHLLSTEPFHFHSLPALATATSLAVLAYLGFDAITTMAEEAKNPKRDIPKAILVALLIGTATMLITGYLGMLVIPNWQQFVNDPSWLSTTLFYVSKLTGGEGFGIFYALGYVFSMAVFNIVATAAGARLLFGMGRDRVLPKAIFSAINERWGTPHWNIALILLLEFGIGMLSTVDAIAELVNYGALLGFILLNLSLIWLVYVKGTAITTHHPIRKFFLCFVSPFIGVLVMFWVFLSMQHITLIIGSIWLIIGICYTVFGHKTL